MWARHVCSGGRASQCDRQVAHHLDAIGCAAAQRRVSRWAQPAGSSAWITSAQGLRTRKSRATAACSLQLANGSTWPASGPARQTGLVWHGPVWGTGELPEAVSKPVLDVVSLHSDADEHVVIPQRGLGVFPDQLPHERPVSPANAGIFGVFRVCERLAKNLVLVQTLGVIV